MPQKNEKKIKEKHPLKKSAMRIAICASENGFDSYIDMRFGRCNYFVIYDSESGSTEFIPNPYSNSAEDAGALSVQLITSKNVSKIVSGEFGIKIKPLLDSLKIQMIVIKKAEMRVSEIIKLLNR